LEGTIHSLWTIAILHGCLIPKGEFGLLEDLVEIGIYCDIAGGIVMDRNGNFESRMCSSTTTEEKGCDSRRCRTKSHLALCTDGCSYDVADMGLSTPSSAVK
jgi:hypothetical protein